MFINSIELKNFKNYEDLKLDLASNKILLIGKNAQGKTNLLEAIYYMSSLTPFRSQTDKELIQWNKDFTTIRLNMTKNDVEINLETVINPPNKKKNSVNGIKKTKIQDFISNLSAVCFSVNDLLLLRGTPEDRRKWLDCAILQILPSYAERLSKYNKIRIQKNNYLKELKASLNPDTSMLDVWNEQLAVTGSNIIYIRLNFLKEMQKIAAEKHSKISNDEKLTIKYLCKIFDEETSLDFETIPSTQEIYEKFISKLQEKKQEEIVRAQSVVGPHRDDVEFYINGINSVKFASQGQQRTIVLALKLSELEIIQSKTGDSAILLLDDVLAELDDIRQNYLLDAIGENIQTIITSVDTLHFKDEYLKNVKIYKISTDENNNAHCSDY